MEKLIQTPCGPIQGCVCPRPGVIAFKGIRYATAGRWEYPKLVTSWEGVYDATAYGHCSYQPRAFYDEEQNEKKYFYYNEFRKGRTYTYSEDCLFLNIWIPEDAKPDDRLPVLVYIHGGGYTGGCGHERHFEDPVWAQRGIIGVTINYRLGPMGFACLPELAEEAGHTGNYGLYDQIAALHWVQDNIASFGGDPEKVTIMGQSAGAMSVQNLCQCALTDGLFRAAVMSSGGGAGTMLMGSVEKACEFWKQVMALSGCETLAQFRALEPEKLFEVWTRAKKEIKGGGMSGVPVKDGDFGAKDAPKKNIPYLSGTTSHDMMPPILFSMTKAWGKGEAFPNYVWYFDRMLPGDDCGAWHSSDLWYWFGTLCNCWRPMEKKDFDLSHQMVSYLMNFCKFGDPNGTSLPAWIPGGKKALCLGEAPTHMGNANLAKLVYTMATNKAVGE